MSIRTALGLGAAATATKPLNGDDLFGKDQPVATSENPTRQASLLTAAQIENDCPASIQELGTRIAALFEKLVQCEEKAEQHKIAIGQLLAQAKEACDVGGFKMFRERFCPNLGKSRAHELLQIASGKKTIAQVKTATRGRVQKHRATKAAAPKPKPSVTVTDKLSPEVPALDGVPKDDAKSARALAEFKHACKEYLPKLNAEHLHEAIDHCTSFRKSEQVP